MARNRSGRKGGFLDRYNPAEVYLQKPERKRGAPGVLEGSSPSGDPLLIRVWPRSGKVDDKDLVEIWRDELRLLHRLGGAPGAEEYIARLVDAGEDPRGFYIVIAAGQRRPIAVLLERGKSGADWLRLTSSAGNRRRLWTNLKRIVAGIEVLHSQGLIHCNLDVWSVLSSGDVEPDFQLTGFEWSMRLMASVDNRSKQGASQRTMSFVDDWKDFAGFAAALLNAEVSRLMNLRIPHYEVAEHVTAEEAWLLRELLSPSPLLQLDGDYITRRIDIIIQTLEGVASAEEPQYQLVLGLGKESDLSRAIRDASDLSIDIDDIPAQLDFIRGDLANPRALAVGKAEDFSLLLRGVDLVYRLRKYAVAGTGTPTWEFALCEKAQLGRDFVAPFLSDDFLPPGSLRTMTFREAAQRAPRARGRVLSWEGVRRRLVAATPKAQTRESRIYKSLTLLHAVDLVSTVAEVFPVKAKLIPSTNGEGALVEVSLHADPDRAKLGELLKLRSDEQRLEQLLEREIADDEGWRLAEARPLGRRAVGDVELQFESAQRNEQATRFLFRTTSSYAGVPADAILIPGEFRGRISQFRRRANALRALLGHTELLRMLSDFRGGVTESHETLVEDEHVERLDVAKKEAFRELTAVLPLYLVQGPPGVGKTFLVREVIRRRLADEPTARLLLTAQSHHAVDHLMAQVQKDWIDPDAAPLAVRSRASEESEGSGPLDLRPRSQALIDDLAESDLVKTCSPGLSAKLRDLTSSSNDVSKLGTAERRLVEGLVMRAANIVFSTTNSGDLERLLEERGQFDWAIVEEAGKATGIELLLPLLLSYRRLMIGDHKQLPPYGSERLNALLSRPTDLRSAMKLGLELIERSLRDVIPDDLQEDLDGESSDDEFAALCSEAQRALFFFETMIDTEMTRQKKPGARGAPVARTLNIQHRMHPDIARLVSRCFYDSDLDTDAEAKIRFGQDVCPVRAVRPLVIPDAPIVIVDMPYEAGMKGHRDIERLPRYSNDQEINAVSKIISNIAGVASGDKKPSLVVLSPYARQVARLQSELLDDKQVSAALATFEPVARHGVWCSTVDAFQGNEADAVIVSLVRNNHHATARKALGFVSDPRRMNVLLSRAQWRLYIVTSLDFLRTVTEPLGQENNEEEGFLKEMLVALDEYIKAGIAMKVDGAALLESGK